MTIPQARITGSLDSALDLFDSTDPAIDFLQIVDAAISIEPWKTQGYSLYYDSSGALPKANASLEGMTALTASNTTGESSLWLNTGDDWKEVQQFASKPLTSIPWNIALNSFSNYGFTGQAFTGNYSTNYLPTTNRNNVDKFALVNAGTPVTSAGSLTLEPTPQSRSAMVASSDITGGSIFFAGGATAPSPAGTTFILDKWPVISEGAAVDLGDLLNNDLSPNNSRSWSDNFNSYGYVYGASPPSFPDPTKVTYIDNYPFVAPYTALANVGSFSFPAIGNSGSSISESYNGYFVGGNDYLGTVSKYSFGSSPGSTLALQPFTLTEKRIQLGKHGIGSTIHGYQVGGRYQTPLAPSPSPVTNTVSYFSFSSGANFVKTQTLGTSVRTNSGVSGTDYGYSVGGYSGPLTSSGNIETFPYASDDTPFVTVGTLTSGGTSATGVPTGGN